MLGRSKLKLFFKWGIEFDTDKYAVADKGAREVKYITKEIIEKNILEAFPPPEPKIQKPTRRVIGNTGGGQSVMQSNEPLIRPPANPLRTD